MTGFQGEIGRGQATLNGSFANLPGVLRVLHVVQSLDPSWGGMARVVPELAAGLTSHGVESRIAALAGGRYGNPPDAGASASPADARGAAANSPTAGTERRVEILTFPASDGPLGRSRAFDRAIGRLVEAADVVHLHGLWTAQNWSAGAAARRAGRPYVMTPHSMMMPWAWRRSAWKKRPIGWLFEHRNLRGASRLHALAEGEARHMRVLGFNPRIETIPNGLWAEEYQRVPPADDLVREHPELADRKWLLFLSRLHVQKGIAPLMQACLDAAGLRDDWQLVIAGPDPLGLRGLFEAAARRKGLAERVTFLGMLDRARVRAALGRAAVFAQPSLSEGLSMSILEALAAGVPVLISDQCNLPEVQEAGAGRVVAPQRRSIAAALRELLALGEAERAEMGRRARALAAERFDWSRLLPRYRALYDAACAGMPPTG